MRPFCLKRSSFQLPIVLGCLFFSCTVPKLHAQRWPEALELLKMKQIDTARYVIDQDVEQAPGKALAMSWYVRGLVYKSIYDREDYRERYKAESIDLQAFDSYKRAMAFDKQNELSEGILEDILSLTDDFAQTGLELFEKGLEGRDPHMMAQAARYLDCVSEAFVLLGARAVPVFKILEDFGVQRQGLEVCRAMAKDASGNGAEAIPIYEQLVRDKTTEPAVYLKLKEHYAAQGRRNRALEVLAAGRKQTPKQLSLHLAYAELLADTARATEGIRMAIDLHRANPEDAAPLTTAGFIEEKRKQFDKAETYYQQALALEPQDFLANFRMGKLYFKRAEENKQAKATQLYVRELQKQSLQYAESAALADPRNPGNLRILFELYQALGESEKASQTRSMMN
jgi:tetratricopeptide (TPR) repeat protein